MPEVEVLYEHETANLTVGQLRAALAGIPDDLPVTVWAVDKPGGDFAEELVLCSAVRATGTDDDHEVALPEFILEADFPTGSYYRIEWRD